MTSIDLDFYTVATIAAFLVGMAKGALPAIGSLGVPIPALVT